MEEAEAEAEAGAAGAPDEHEPAIAEQIDALADPGLAHLAPPELDSYFARAKLKPMTEPTTVNKQRLCEILSGVREDGDALIDEELELGLRSIAVPVHGASGEVLAALNAGAQAGRVNADRMKQEFLPALLRSAQRPSVLLP